MGEPTPIATRRVLLLALLLALLRPGVAAAQDEGSPLASGLDEIEKHYVLAIPRAELERRALAALLRELDPYSRYLDPGDAKQLDDDFGAVAGPSVQPLLAAASANGNADADARWWIDRTRRIGYIRITEMATDTAARVDAALAALMRGHARGVVLDLRECGGGLLRPALDVADLLINKGLLLTLRERGRETHFEATRGKYTRLALVVLINGHTASSAEILAGALKDRDRALLVGERSYGKGRIQTVYTLGGGRGGMVLSTGTFERPNGHTIDRHDVAEDSTDAGITPDIVVAMDPLQLAAWRDAFTAPVMLAPVTLAPVTLAQTTLAATTLAPATLAPATLAPATLAPATPGPIVDPALARAQVLLSR